jgi:hypothetical protein
MGDRFPEIMTETKLGVRDWGARGKRQEALGKRPRV